MLSRLTVRILSHVWFLNEWVSLTRLPKSINTDAIGHVMVLTATLKVNPDHAIRRVASTSSCRLANYLYNAIIRYTDLVGIAKINENRHQELSCLRRSHIVVLCSLRVQIHLRQICNFTRTRRKRSHIKERRTSDKQARARLTVCKQEATSTLSDALRRHSNSC